MRGVVAAVADDDIVLRAIAAQPDIDRANIGLRAEAISDDAAFGEARNQALHDGMIDAENVEAIKRYAAGIIFKALLQGFEAAVMVEMFRVDIGDDCDRRRQLQERAVAFVGFDNHPVAGAETSVGVVRIDDAAIDDRRIASRGFEQRADHRGRRRLAVRAGDGDGPFEAHQLAQHLGAAHDGKQALARGLDFRVVGFDRRGNNDDARIAQIFGAMADRDFHPEFLQPAHVRAVGNVAALHLVAEVMQNLGDAAHADAADADEMQRADIEGQGSHAARSSA